MEMRVSDKIAGIFWSEIQLECNNRSQIAGTGVEAALHADLQPVPDAEEDTRGYAFIGLPR